MKWFELAQEQCARFWAKVDKFGPIPTSRPELGPCWDWKSGLGADGYGKFQITGRRGELPKQKHVRAHRLSYELTHGPIDDGLSALHVCDRPLCVNPSHLFLGTQSDNRADCTAKGRNASGPRHGSKTKPESRPRGETHYKSRMTEADVLSARNLRLEGHSMVKIARRLGRSYHAVTSAIYRKSWKHVD